MIMPDAVREECFRTAVFMNKFENGKEKRRDLLRDKFNEDPDDIKTAYTYAAYCFLYGEKGDILQQKDAIVEAQRVFAIIAQKNPEEWLARYFNIRLDMLVSDDYRNDADLDKLIDELANAEGSADHPCCQLTKLLKAESIFNLRKYTEAERMLDKEFEEVKRVQVLKDFFFNQVSSFYRKLIVCQNKELAQAVAEIQEKMFGKPA